MINGSPSLRSVNSNCEGGHDMKAEVDWKELRERSLKPGGFGKERVKIWYIWNFSVLCLIDLNRRTQLLNITTSEGETKKLLDAVSIDGSPHHDERQIVLDTDRSFVLYPVGGKTPLWPLSVSLKFVQTLVAIERHSNLAFMTFLSRCFAKDHDCIISK